jgi:hypothetical protein
MKALTAYAVPGAAVAVVVLALAALAWRAVWSEESGGEIGLTLGPGFDPELGFANETSNCPESPGEADAEARSLVALVEPVSTAPAVGDGAELRGFTIMEPTTARYTFTTTGVAAIMHVLVRDFASQEAERRITSVREELPEPAPPLPALDLSMLRLGPSAAVHIVRAASDGTLQPFFASLGTEGCHLVWYVVSTDAAREWVLARVSNTTGELRWQPAPVPPWVRPGP